jgi:NTP pyrophosphatase (non-canonical NTP hydrolase)
MDNSRTFHEIIEITRKVITAFDHVETRPWTIEVSLIELMKQVGDLSKRVLTFEQYYLTDRMTRPDYQTSVEDIGDELADILYCIIRIADHYHVDLESAHIEARRQEMRYIGHEPDF